MLWFLFSALNNLDAQNLLDPLSQEKYINELPIPAILEPHTGMNYYEVSITQFSQHLGLYDLTGEPLMTTVWGYNGSYPGPTIEARKDQAITVRWENNLVDSQGEPLDHLFPVDPTLHWANPEVGVPSVTHLHGGHTEAESDGNPQAWYTPYFQEKGAYFAKENYEYSNDQEAATLWYHDHALGVTRLNVYAGLAGFYLLRDSWEEQLNLPTDEYEIPLVIQDRSFYDDGALYYPSEPELLEDPLVQPLPSAVTVLPEMFGEFILVNGKTWPYVSVEPRKYRVRLLNGSDSRFYELFLPGITFQQIGADGGLLNQPVPKNKLIIGPGERLDVIVDFSSVPGKQLILRNTARSPYPFGATPNPNTTGQIMAFNVSQTLSSPDTSVIPTPLRSSPISDLGKSNTTRQLVLYEGTDEYGRLKPLLGTAEKGPLEYMDEITENPMLNSVEEWEIYNTTADAHPIHLHLVHFQVIHTQKFNAKKSHYGQEDYEVDDPYFELLGQPKPPAPENAGWKDTFIVLPGEVAKVKAKFDKEGLYVWHCHILSHEDYEMMRPFYVGIIPGDLASWGKMASESSLEDKNPGKENDLIEAFTVSPNPFSESTEIKLRAKRTDYANINLYEMNGKFMKVLYSGKIQADQDLRIQLNNTGMPPGMYVVKVQMGDGTTYEKRILTN